MIPQRGHLPCLSWHRPVRVCVREGSPSMSRTQCEGRRGKGGRGGGGEEKDDEERVAKEGGEGRGRGRGGEKERGEGFTLRILSTTAIRREESGTTRCCVRPGIAYHGADIT